VALHKFLTYRIYTLHTYLQAWNPDVA